MPLDFLKVIPLLTELGCKEMDNRSKGANFVSVFFGTSTLTNIGVGISRKCV